MADGTRTYTGVWTNWSHGRVHGATITLSRESGGILAAFLAIYVAYAGGKFWRILSFAAHQLKTTPPSRTRDALHYQRQVILRNSGSGGGALWALSVLPFRNQR